MVDVNVLLKNTVIRLRMLHRNIVWSLIVVEHNCRNTFTVIGKIIGRL